MSIIRPSNSYLEKKNITQLFKRKKWGTYDHITDSDKMLPVTSVTFVLYSLSIYLAKQTFQLEVILVHNLDGTEIEAEALHPLLELESNTAIMVLKHGEKWG